MWQVIIFFQIIERNNDPETMSLGVCVCVCEKGLIKHSVPAQFKTIGVLK